MIYDYYHYNNPSIGNKRMYAYSETYQSLEHCDLISADNKAQAQIVLNANNRAWQQDCVLLDYSKEQCQQKYDRRKQVALDKSYE